MAKRIPHFPHDPNNSISFPINLVIVDGDVPRGDELEVGVEMTGRERTQKQLFVKLVRRRRENEGTP